MDILMALILVGGIGLFLSIPDIRDALALPETPRSYGVPPRDEGTPPPPPPQRQRPAFSGIYVPCPACPDEPDAPAPPYWECEQHG